MTKVTLENGDAWRTLGFEAFGTMATVVNDVHAVAAALAARQPPALAGGIIASYPAWLGAYACK